MGGELLLRALLYAKGDRKEWETEGTMDRYQKIEKNGGGNLGEGTYGVVYKAKDRETEEIVALKVRQLLLLS